jgi:general secretion pathway protein J
MRRWLFSRAFTLIEVLVSVAIFGILAALAYGTLSQTLSGADMLTVRMERLAAIQRTVRYLSDDFMQLAPRPVRDELGDSFQAALRTGIDSTYAVELTRAGWNNPAGLPRSTLQRVAYGIQDDELLRYHWAVLDRTLANEPVAHALLEGIESLEFRFMRDNGEWSPEWPPTGQGGPLGLRMRPRAVEIVLNLVDEGEITRLIEVAP